MNEEAGGGAGVDQEAAEFRRAREQIKSEFARLADEFGERALQGELLGITFVTVEKSGNVGAGFLGIRMTEAIGMLEAGKALLTRKLMS